jgi:hypothetical protein
MELLSYDLKKICQQFPLACTFGLMQRKMYFLAILPPADVADRIIAFRKKYLQGIQVGDEHKKFPHVTMQHTFHRKSRLRKR